MKPYRGTLLAAAMLLATLPLSGCGDADSWEKTTEIKLSAPAPEGLNEIVYTVVSPPPAEGYACETILQYRAEGAGVNIQWANIPGTETTRLFSVRPQGEGVLSVVARGMCADSKEDWKYSNQVDTTVTALPRPTVTAVTIAANPTTVVKNNWVTFTLSATKTEGCTLALKYQYTGAGFAGITTVNPAAPGLFQLKPTQAGALVVTATGVCTENPTVPVTGSVTVTVTDTVVVLPTITVPDTPTHVGTVTSGVPEVFTSGGATCSNGEAVQYEFSATNSPVEGSPTAWGPSNTVSYTWGVALPAVTVSVRARCVTSTTVVTPYVTTGTFAVL